MIVLNLKEIRFMLTVLPLPSDIRGILEGLVLEPKKSISDEIADELRDMCTDRLDVYGFDEDYNPTEEGEILEALIDKLYIG